MTTFGFSAFLKLLSLNGRPQRSEVAKRLKSRTGKAYDYHREMRRISGLYLSGALDLAGAVALAKDIKQEPERRSAIGALQKLDAWKQNRPAFSVVSRTYETPNAAFKVRFDPSFGIEIDGQRVAVHLWNTMTPALDARMTRAALSLFAALYEDIDDLAVLSLRTSQILRLRLSENPGAATIGANVIDALEIIFDDLRPSDPQPGDEEHPQPA